MVMYTINNNIQVMIESVHTATILLLTQGLGGKAQLPSP